MTKTKTLLKASGKVVVLVLIIDNDGDRSVQRGSSWVEDVKTQFSIAFDHAVYNAVYKHYSKLGFHELETDTYDVFDFVKHVKVKDYWIEYGEFNQPLEVKRLKSSEGYISVARDSKGHIVSKSKWRNSVVNRREVNKFYEFSKESKRNKPKVKLALRG